MALWGKTDNLAGRPKFVARKAFFDASSTTIVIAATDRINLLQSNTGFASGDELIYSSAGGTAIGGLTSGNTYYSRVVDAGIIELYDTYAHAIDFANTTGRVNITDVGVGTAHTLQRTGAANPFDHVWGKSIFFVDREEAQNPDNKLIGIHGGGWYLYQTYVDANGMDRHKVSCLVAMDVPSSESGDSDVGGPSLVKSLTITTHPEDLTVTTSEAGEFTVVAEVTGGTGSEVITYQWQIGEPGDVNSFEDVTEVHGWLTGATTDTLSFTSTFLIQSGRGFRCVVSSDGLASKTSNIATLTVTG